MKQDHLYIDIHQLHAGMYVDLELNWMEHPFLRSKFRIQSQAEIKQIKALKLKKIKILIHKSDKTALQSLKNPADTSIETDDEYEIDFREDDDSYWQQKRSSLSKAEDYKKEHRKVVQQYRETEKRIGNLARNLRIAPANAIRDAEEVIQDITGLLTDSDNLVVSMVNLSSNEYTVRHHSLNVTVLALALGKSLNLDNEQLHELGVGALLHDVGKVGLPVELLRKTTALTMPEQQLLRTHVSLGTNLVTRLEQTPKAAIDIIAKHHTYLDGSGFPPDIGGDDISPICRIVQICNHYENMCNPSSGQRPFSPKVAMAKLFAGFEGKLDGELIHRFVRNLGVYPPGTVVLLNDESIAVVVSVNSDSLLQPKILIYHPEVPANQALMIDLKEQPDISIEQALKPGEYPAAVKDYLGLEDQLGYFISPGG